MGDPFTFYNTRLQIIAPATAFFHSDGYTRTASLPGGTATPLTDGRTRFYNQFPGVQLAHDFGHDFGGSFTGLIYPPNQAFVPDFSTELIGALSYTGNGWNITGNVIYTGSFGSKNRLLPSAPNSSLNAVVPGAGNLPGLADNLELDLTVVKKFGKFEAGFVGFAQSDIENAIDNSNGLGFTGRRGPNGFTRAGAAAVGGLVGYDFGRFSAQAFVTREVATRGAPQLFTGTGKETRGFLRVVVPIYVAPTAPVPVVAKF